MIYNPPAGPTRIEHQHQTRAAPEAEVLPWCDDCDAEMIRAARRVPASEHRVSDGQAESLGIAVDVWECPNEECESALLDVSEMEVQG